MLEEMKKGALGPYHRRRCGQGICCKRRKCDLETGPDKGESDPPQRARLLQSVMLRVEADGLAESDIKNGDEGRQKKKNNLDV